MIMNQQIKSFYLTYQGRPASPEFENLDGVATKVLKLYDAFKDLGVEMEIRCIINYPVENGES